MVSAAAAADRLLEGLNGPQRDAVAHGDGPLLILAGAGSGKTRVLTHRIAHLVATGRAHPGQILAITFTNKAAHEMRERVEQLVGPSVRRMWVMTFHSACARILRAHAERLGYRRAFTIYDEDDSLRLVKRCVDELDLDPKRFTPRALKRQISDAKNGLLSPEEYRSRSGTMFEETAADVFELYERRILDMNAMDFDDLLVRCVNLLELFPEVRRGYQDTFRHVMVDEYQDTNRAQYRWLQLLAGEHRNLCVVGDDDQCLVAGTPVTMADGSIKPIEDIVVGDQVLSCHGSGDFRPARVMRTHRSEAREGIAITTRGGRRLVSTPEHTHFAGFRYGVSPQAHVTYLMRRSDKGFRVGTTRTYTASNRTLGVRLRSVQEHADAAWVVSQHETEAEARAEEARLSLIYGIPTLPFVARRGGSANGLVCDHALIDRVFEAVDGNGGALDLLEDAGLSRTHPHHSAQTHQGRRRVLTVVLCGDRRGPTPMHVVSIGGRDGLARAALERIGLNVRPARAGASWRYESAFADFGEAMAIVARIRRSVPVQLRMTARLGAGPERGRRSLPFIPAASIRPGMAMFDASGEYDVVETVDRVRIDAGVYDLDIEHTHNFIAGGLLTHNSIYSFRGADIRNILDFEDDFPDAAVVKLEQNYRSTQTILDAANSVIGNNHGRKEKALWSELGQGEPVHLRELEDEHAEARFVAGEIERRVDEGESRDEMAVFYRTNAQSRVLEEVLGRYAVPHKVIGGRRFYERKEIRDALAYLTFLTNPSDAIALARIVGSPKRGIGDTTLSRIVGHANTIGEVVWEIAARPDLVPGLGAGAVKSVGRFMEVMERLRESAEGATSVGDLLEETLNETGYIEALQAERTIESEGRLENLQELVTGAREYDATTEDPNVSDYLETISLRADTDDLGDESGTVTLMTLHSAKGLEYPIVFILGCEDGIFPSSRAIESGDLEEERRLCYVGITRAKRELFLSFARTRARHGSREWNSPSRFLTEVPAHLTDATERLGAPVRQPRWDSGPSHAAPAARREPSPPAAAFALGDSVTHAKFGEGVVTAREPGGIVVVNFPGEGEKKLMEDYAPLKKVTG